MNILFVEDESKIANFVQAGLKAMPQIPGALPLRYAGLVEINAA